ncbi:hypothetical protein E2562_033611 [Oryza meyeriana var. granulata]|uniref:Uncharacterized protein n=1 Tax=Oryza meyeriana var. granulata TaxID=110450 RepID=A0A6G1FES8_9ORYZ|nr:hypothetical protein E2562_033611 [Oryza meyeriana var. granulata]
MATGYEPAPHAVPRRPSPHRALAPRRILFGRLRFGRGCWPPLRRALATHLHAVPSAAVCGAEIMLLPTCGAPCMQCTQQQAALQLRPEPTATGP